MNDSSYWQMLQAMTPHERELFLIQEQALEDKRRLAWLMEQYRQANPWIETARALAKSALADYNISNDEEDLARVELYASWISEYQRLKHEMREEIKEVREHIRWLRAEYRRKMQQKS